MNMQVSTLAYIYNYIYTVMFFCSWHQLCVVPLGVILKNENKLEGMASIIETLEEYVPNIRKSQTVPSHDDDSSQPDVIENDHFHHILFGGDQLTCARARGGSKD